MRKPDPRVTAYINTRAPFARPILKAVRRAFRASNTSLDETIKWGMPAFLFDGKLVGGFAGFKAHCAIYFWKGRTVVPKGSTDAMGHFGRITCVEQLPSDAQMRSYVKAVIGLIDEKKAATQETTRKAAKGRAVGGRR